MLKVLPLYLAGVAVASYWPNQNTIAFAWLGGGWWMLGPKFRGSSGVRWRAWLSAIVFCTAMAVSGYFFIEVWNLGWAGLWIFLVTAAASAAVQPKESKPDEGTAPPDPEASASASASASVSAIITPADTPVFASPLFRAFDAVRRGGLLLLAALCLLGGVAFVANSARTIERPVATTTQLGPELLGTRMKLQSEAAQTNGMDFALGINLVASGLLALNRGLRRRDGSGGPIDQMLALRWAFGKVPGDAAWPLAAVILFVIATGWLGYQALARTQFHFSPAVAAEAFRKDANFNLYLTGNLIYGVTADGKTTHIAHFTPMMVRALDRNQTSVFSPLRPREYPLPGVLPVAVLLTLAFVALQRKRREARVQQGEPQQPDIATARALLIFGLVNLYVVAWLALGQRNSLFMDTRFFQAGVIDPDGLVNAMLLLVASGAVLAVVYRKIEEKRLPLATRLGWTWFYFAASLSAVAWSYGFSNAAPGSPVLLWILLYLAAGALCWFTIHPEDATRKPS